MNKRERSRERGYRDRDKPPSRGNELLRRDDRYSRDRRDERDGERYTEKRQRRRSRSTSRDRGGRRREERGYKDEFGRWRTEKRSESPEAVRIVRPVEEVVKVEEAVVELTEDELMRQMMGFGGFETTKEKKVEGADVSASDVVKKRNFKQFMNRYHTT